MSTSESQYMTPSRYISLFGYQPLMTAGFITFLGTASMVGLHYNFFGQVPVGMARHRRGNVITAGFATVLFSSLVIFQPIGTYRRQMQMRRAMEALDGGRAGESRETEGDRTSNSVGSALKEAWKDQAKRDMLEGNGHEHSE